MKALKEWTPDPKPLPKAKKTQADHVKALKERTIKTMLKKNQPLWDNDFEFLISVWNSYDTHRCAECNDNLGDKYEKIFMNHIIEKSKHPELRYEIANINIYCRSCHRNFHDNPSEKMKQVISFTKKYFGIYE